MLYLESLERMVVSFAHDYNPEIQASVVLEQVRTGDLSTVLKEYGILQMLIVLESDIKKPVSALVNGSLIRSLLIQIQKVKVDGALVMSALDQLLRSNELNFAFLAIIPTILISYGLVNYGKKLLVDKQLHGKSKQVERVRYSLRDIERLLNIHQTKDNLFVGELLCLLVYLKQSIIDSSVPSQQKSVFLEDIHDLELFALYDRAETTKGIDILNRIWRTHSFLCGR
ncbi:Nuclear control of ATPase protein 2 [Globomyces sp. JEL0801]|nr:Nuclear control of ATPase protein 2 [Globomyces sp. JEL0801]